MNHYVQVADISHDQHGLLGDDKKALSQGVLPNTWQSASDDRTGHSLQNTYAPYSINPSHTPSISNAYSTHNCKDFTDPTRPTIVKTSPTLLKPFPSSDCPYCPTAIQHADPLRGPRHHPDCHRRRDQEGILQKDITEPSRQASRRGGEIHQDYAVPHRCVRNPRQHCSSYIIQYPNRRALLRLQAASATRGGYYIST